MRYFLMILAMLALPVSAQQVPQSAAQMQLSFVPLVQQATPAVVNIYARIMTRPQRTPLQSDPFFERFFRDPFAEKPRVQNSLGSGVILSADGIIVSNYHVVGMASDVRVVLNDRREFSARVLMGDADMDLAILKIEASEPLPFLPLRQSDTVEVGELALAIGNPFGVGQTVSSGIVSGLARTGAAGGTGFGYFIQTDAPINPGNSGGALIDVQGRLIGVNTSILTRSGGSNGIGFAIPADLVGTFVAQARDGLTTFQRPWAGIGGQPLDADMAASFGLARPGGIIIAALHPMSPFLDAGFEVGDVITAVDGAPVNTPGEMVYRMSVAGTGLTVPVTGLRDGREQIRPVPLLIAPEMPPRATVELARDTALPGLTLSMINPAVLTELSLPLEAAGVAVVDPGPYGPRVGLRRGDIVVEINRQPLTHPGQAETLLGASRGRVEMVIERGNRRRVIRFRV